VNTRTAPEALAQRARPVSAVDLSPPVAPNLPRRTVPGAKDVGRNTVETLLFRGLSTPIALVLVVLQSRFLEPSGRGAFVLAVLGVTIFSRLLGQLGVAVTSRLAQPDADLRRLVQRALALGILLGTAGSIVVFLVGAASEDLGPRVALLAALALVPNVLWQTVSGVLLGLARVRLWNYIQILPPVLTVLGMVAFVVVMDWGVAGAVGAWAAANAATAVVALTAAHHAWRPADFPNVVDPVSRALARFAITMGAVQVVNLISYRVELFVLRRFEELRDVGIYSIAMQAAEAMWLVAGAIATAVTAPAVHETEHRAHELVGRSALRALLLTSGVAVVVGLAAPFLVPLLFGEDFSDSVQPLWVLLPGIVAYAPVTVLVVYLSVRRGRPRLSLAVSVAAMVVTTGAALVLIPAWGITGAALASTLGYAAGGALAWIFFARLKDDPPRRSAAETAASEAPAAR
jgi:O-antigen/teichoic acid export membrane protein